MSWYGKYKPYIDSLELVEDIPLFIGGKVKEYGKSLNKEGYQITQFFSEISNNDLDNDLKILLNKGYSLVKDVTFAETSNESILNVFKSLICNLASYRLVSELFEKYKNIDGFKKAINKKETKLQTKCYFYIPENFEKITEKYNNFEDICKLIFLEEIKELGYDYNLADENFENLVKLKLILEEEVSGIEIPDWYKYVEETVKVQAENLAETLASIYSFAYQDIVLNLIDLNGRIYNIDKDYKCVVQRHKAGNKTTFLAVQGFVNSFRELNKLTPSKEKFEINTSLPSTEKENYSRVRETEQFLGMHAYLSKRKIPALLEKDGKLYYQIKSISRHSDLETSLSQHFLIPLYRTFILNWSEVVEDGQKVISEYYNSSLDNEDVFETVITKIENAVAKELSDLTKRFSRIICSYSDLTLDDKKQSTFLFITSDNVESDGAKYKSDFESIFSRLDKNLASSVFNNSALTVYARCTNKTMAPLDNKKSYKRKGCFILNQKHT